MAAFDKLILRKRSSIETINNPLKNIFNLGQVYKGGDFWKETEDNRSIGEL
jgi:hypothetical protein